jgi:hypothetical protein
MPEKTVKGTPLITELPPGGPVNLRDAVHSMLGSLLQARMGLDQQTAIIARLYQQDELLRQFQPPGFALQEVTLHLPYAAVDVRPLTPNDPAYKDLGQVPQLLVQLNAEQLAKLPPHAVAYVELKLNEQQLALLLPNQA